MANFYTPMHILLSLNESEVSSNLKKKQSKKKRQRGVCALPLGNIVQELRDP